MWSGELTKINKRKRYQQRNFVITTNYLVNIGTLGSEKLIDSFKGLFTSQVKRKISLSLIKLITYSEISNEFVLHIPSEYDYRLRSFSQ